VIELLGGIASYLVFFAVFAGIFALITLGLNLHWGVSGLFNVGVAGFVAVGAYTSALLTAPSAPDRWGGFDLPVPIGLVGAMVAAGLVAFMVGGPALRLRHDYLAITTFGVAVTIQLIALNATKLTGGPFGFGFIPRPLHNRIPGETLWDGLYLAVVCALVALARGATERLVGGPWGRVLRAIREDEAAAAALGKHAFRFRLEAFVLGAMAMGLGGAFYAHFIGFIAAEDFLPILTFQIWTMLIVGGAGNTTGAIAGAAVVWGIWTASGAAMGAVLPPEMRVRGAALQVILIGLALAAMLLWRPRGLFGERLAVSRYLDEAGDSSSVSSPRSNAVGVGGQPPI
jgi:branched-chain amino acid transport system permease protein